MQRLNTKMPASNIPATRKDGRYAMFLSMDRWGRGAGTGWSLILIAIDYRKSNPGVKEVFKWRRLHQKVITTPENLTEENQ